MGNESVINNWKQIQDTWLKFVSYINDKINQLIKRLKEEITPEERKCEVFLRELYRGRDGFEFLVKHREALIKFDPEFIDIFKLYDAFNESDALGNSAFLETWQALIDNKILQFESRIEENKNKRKELESELLKLRDLVDESSYGAIKSLLEEANLSAQEIVYNAKYVQYNSSRKTIAKEKTNSKFKSRNKEEIKKQKEERRLEISKNIDIENSRYEGLKEKYKTIYSEFYNQFKSFGTTNINAIRYEIKSETLLAGLELYLRLENIRKDIEEVINLINNGEIDEDNLELLRTSINEFQSVSAKLATIYEEYMQELSKTPEEEEVNPNVFFYVANPHNPYEADKANVFPNLVTQELDDKFFQNGRTKSDSNNPDVAGKKIYFRQYKKNSVISFIKTGSYGVDSRILVLASITIKNTGTDEIHKLTERVTRNEEEIQKLIEAIESGNKEVIELQNMIRIGLINKRKSSSSQKRR